MAAASAYSSISAGLRPPLLPIRFSSPPPPHRCGSPSSSKPDKARSLAFTSLVVGRVGVALATSAFLAPAAALAVLEEPANALSLPTWAIHVSSVVEWVTAMVLVWEYGDKSGCEAWKGLSWGMHKVSDVGDTICISKILSQQHLQRSSTSWGSIVRMHLAFLLQLRVSRGTGSYTSWIDSDR